MGSCASFGEKKLEENVLSYFSVKKSTKRNFVFIALFTDEKRGKSQKEERFPLLNSFCRLAATSANKVPRPSR